MFLSGSPRKRFDKAIKSGAIFTVVLNDRFVNEVRNVMLDLRLTGENNAVSGAIAERLVAAIPDICERRFGHHVEDFKPTEGLQFSLPEPTECR